MLRQERFEELTTAESPRIAWMGTILYEPVAVITPHVHCYYEVSLITEGSVEYTVQDSVYLLDTWDLCITKPGELHRMADARGAEWGKAYIGVDSIAPPELAYEFENTQVRCIRGCRELASQFDRILDEIRRPRFASAEMLRTLVTAWLIEVGRRLQPSEMPPIRNSMPEVVYEARGFIEMYAHHRLSPAEVAQYVGLSESHLCHVFSECTHTPMYTYIRRTVMQRAVRLLQEGRLSVSQVSDTLEFPSVSYFSAAFRRYFGYPPTHLKRHGCPTRSLPPYASVP